MVVGKAGSRIVILLGFLLGMTACLCSCNKFSESEKITRKKCQKIKVLVVTGGHGFEKESFFAMFGSFDDIEYAEAVQQEQSNVFEDVTGWNWDVIVLYDMTQEISPQGRKNFLRLLENGVGVVSLHHSIASYQNWPEYREIIGVKYYLRQTEEDGVVHLQGEYKHDVDVRVHVENKKHPITQGMSDFVIRDEVYKKSVFEKDNLVLLSTDHPDSDRPLCWTRKYGRSKVCCIQLGHGPEAYADANYRRLVERAIRWCAGRSDK